MRVDDIARKGEESILLYIQLRAHFNWRADSTSTDTPLEIHVRVSKFISWLKVVDNVILPVVSRPERSPSDFIDAGDATRREVVVEWTVALEVDTQYEHEGPVQREIPTVGTPLQSVTIGVNGDEVTYPA